MAQQNNQEEEEEYDYRQDLGLKKILYKYENQNQQLRSQIKALNQRLHNIMSKPKQQAEPVDPLQEFQGKIEKEEMNNLFKQIKKETQQMKIHKDGIDQRHQNKCQEVNNKIAKMQRQNKLLREKLVKYDQIDDGLKLSDAMKSSNIQKEGLNVDMNKLTNKTLKNSTLRIQNYFQKLNDILEETQATKRSIKQMEKLKNMNARKLVKKHVEQEDAKLRNKIIEYGKPEQILHEEGRKRKGIWGMDNTQQNYEWITNEFESIKGQQQQGLSVIKNQNIVMEKRIGEMQTELEGLNRSAGVSAIPYQNKYAKLPGQLSISVSKKLESPLLTKKTLLYDVDPSEFQSKNDKNYVPKKLRKVVWESTRNNSGIQWYDSKLNSPISGINLWFDKHLLGIEFIQKSGNSAQHLHLMGGKKMMPIQYRLSGNDYVQNVILFISEGLITGIEFISKMGQIDSFGNKGKGKKFDFGIKKPEKPVITLGQFKVSNNVSEITKLGFEVI